MFLYQKFGYDYTHLVPQEVEQGIEKFINKFKVENPDYSVFDTETTGLNIITSIPFLLGIGFNKTIITMDFNADVVKKLWESLGEHKLFAHNCKYDFHMCHNGGAPIPESIKVYDSITVARLTEYADLRESLSLASLGAKYVDESSKFAGDIIKKVLNSINSEKRHHLRDVIMDNFPNDGYFNITKTGNRKGTAKLTQLISDYEKRIQFIDDDNEMYKFISQHFQPATYQDVYEKEPELMKSYAADDVVIALEYLKISLPTLKETDPEGKTIKRESELIRVVAEMERIGLKVDIDYVLRCRDEVLKYRDLLYLELSFLTGKEFSVGQHEYIKRLFLTKYKINMETADEKALTFITENAKDEIAVWVAKNIMELRTIDKWLSTYIEGKLNSVIKGRTHTNINNNGAISGRVSCDMQQQPKKPLKDRDGNELFHPRKMFICDEDRKLFFVDESQMELRVQAYLIQTTSGTPDTKMSQAYIPYLHKHYKTGELYDHTSTEFMSRWDEKKEGSDESAWEDGNGKPWTPTDLHTETTLKAFPDLVVGSDEFKLKRPMGKQANFLKVYLGGVKALMDEIGIEREVAERLDNGFYQAFPRVKFYQDWVVQQAELYGYVENLYGRRYYMQDERFFYKLCNYLIQGTCADMIKQFQIDISRYLKENKLKTVMVLPVHDEIILSVPEDEEHIIKDIRAIMENVTHIIKTIPMIADVEFSNTNWGEKKGWVG